MSAPRVPGHRYVELIDEGGFATVYRYVRESLGREVAIKVMRADALGVNAGEFKAEAQIMAKLSGHPNIVTIHDFGTLDDGRPYLVMEYCPPPNLKVQAESNPLPVTYVLDVGIRIGGAVETAHRAKVLHRDIKPANLLVAGFGPKLADFGIAELRGGQRGTDALSVPWSALEALQGREVDERADVHSLAATLYTLLTGRWAFEQPGQPNEWNDLMARMGSGMPHPIGRSDLPRGLEETLRRAMHPDPDRRPQSAIDLARELQALAPRGWTAPEPLVPEETTRAAMELTQTTARRGGFRAPSPRRMSQVEVDELGTGTGGSGERRATSPGTLPRSRTPVHSGPGDDATRARVIEAPAPPRNRRRPQILGGVAALLCALAVVAVVAFGPDKSPEKATTQPTVAFNPMPLEAGQPGPPKWSRTPTKATLNWGQPSDWQPGDVYRYTRLDADRQPVGTAVPTQETHATVAARKAETVCFQVWVVRSGVPSSHRLTDCNPDQG